MTRKKQLYYIPVTMDELMARFVTNMERQNCKNRFKDKKQILMLDNLKLVEREVIEESVQNSMQALKDLLSCTTIDMERQPNTENKLYLSIIERIQEQEKLKLINMPSTKTCNVVRKAKPEHLGALKALAKALREKVESSGSVDKETI